MEMINSGITFSLAVTLCNITRC